MAINTNKDYFTDDSPQHQYTYIDVPEISSATYSTLDDDKAEHTYSAPDDDTKPTMPQIHSQSADGQNFTYQLAYADEQELSAASGVDKDEQGNNTYFLVEEPNEACEHSAVK